jgi:peptidoglycan hydrolase CwlO-like protein
MGKKKKIMKNIESLKKNIEEHKKKIEEYKKQDGKNYALIAYWERETEKREEEVEKELEKLEK